MFIWLIILVILFFLFISFIIKLHSLVFKTITSTISLVLLFLILFSVFVIYDTNKFVNEFEDSDSLFILYDTSKDETIITGFILQSSQGIMLDDKQIKKMNVEFYNYLNLKKEDKKENEKNTEEVIKEIFFKYLNEILIKFKERAIDEIENIQDDKSTKTKEENNTNDNIYATQDEEVKKNNNIKINNMEHFDYVFAFDINQMENNKKEFIDNYSFNEFFENNFQTDYDSLLLILNSDNSVENFINLYSTKLNKNNISTTQKELENLKKQLTNNKIKAFIFSQIISQNQEKNQLFLFRQSGITMKVVPEKIIFKIMKNNFIKKSIDNMREVL